MERRLRIWLGVAAAFLLLSLTLAGCGTAPQDVIMAPVSAPVVSVPPGGHLLVLSGNATAQRNGEINRVSSKFQYQLTGVGEFTSKDLSSTVILSAGQQLVVTVVISFS